MIVISHWWNQFERLDLKSLGIRVVEGSNANTVAVAEWVLTAALMGIRRLTDFDAKMKEGSLWCEPRRCVGMLYGKRVGLVGLGRIGRYSAVSYTHLDVYKRQELAHVALSRHQWFACACCPPNVARFYLSLGHLFYGVEENKIYVNLYGGNTARIAFSGGEASLSMETEYPSNGKVNLLVDTKEAYCALLLRLPGW